MEFILREILQLTSGEAKIWIDGIHNHFIFNVAPAQISEMRRTVIATEGIAKFRRQAHKKMEENFICNISRSSKIVQTATKESNKCKWG